MTNNHVNPGQLVTVDPRQPIDDSYRSTKFAGQKYYKFPCDNCKHDGFDCPIPEELCSESLAQLNNFQKIVAITGCRHLDPENKNAPIHKINEQRKR